MKVRITYRNEVFIEGKDLKEIRDTFDKLELSTKIADFVEVSSVENTDTLEDLKDKFEHIY